MYQFRSLAVILVLGLTVLTFACRKKDDPSVGGKGGTATLVAVPRHHDVAKNIVTCTVYIKYNDTLPPANNIGYDDSVQCVNANNMCTATFTQLKNGYYYLYSKGFDTSIHQDVVGGISTNISQQGQTHNMSVPVTEGD